MTGLMQSCMEGLEWYLEIIFLSLIPREFVFLIGSKIIFSLQNYILNKFFHHLYFLVFIYLFNFIKTLNLR